VGGDEVDFWKIVCYNYERKIKTTLLLLSESILVYRNGEQRSEETAFSDQRNLTASDFSDRKRNQGGNT